MKIYYRISDNSYPKIKLPGATKKTCLDNLKQTLTPSDDDLIVIADNCSSDTLDLLHKTKHEIHETHEGNAGALLYAMRHALDKKVFQPIYFVEDDYLHEPNRSCHLMQEGARCDRSTKPAWHGHNHGYWTLYDHPDKYQEPYNYHEDSKVFRTKHGHWRTSVSTTMTFATRYKTLQEDFPIWERFLGDAMTNNANHPPDHEIFKALGEAGRKLYVAIPGSAIHADLTTYGNFGVDAIEQWAIDLMFDHLYEECSKSEYAKAMMLNMFDTETPSKTFATLSRMTAICEGIFGATHFDST